MEKVIKVFLLIILSFFISACSGKHVRVNKDNSLSLCGCTPLPNCISTNTWILYNRTSEFKLRMPAKDAWPMIKKVISNKARTEIVEANDVYIHAKCRSRVFRFVDNLELLLQPDKKTISVRSSSVIAIFDLFVNRIRIWSLRKKLKKMGIILAD